MSGARVAREAAIGQIVVWAENPPAFVSDNFQTEPDPWQAQALRLFASPDPADQRIALQASVGPGKSTVLAWAALWFLSCTGERGEHPQGAAVSYTRENLRDNLWKEIAKWRNRSEYLRRTLEWNTERVCATDHKSTWFISARTWPKTANAEEQGRTLAGLHSKYVAAFIDESGGIPPPVLRAAEQALANCWFGKILQAGNPISLEGMLYLVATRLRDQWRIIVVTGDPDDKKSWVHLPRVGEGPLRWAREQIGKYGRENPWVKSYILGQFPPASPNAILSLAEVLSAQGKHLRRDAYEWSQKRLGVDVARFGDDRTVLFPRQGLASFKPTVMRLERDTAASMDVAAAILRARDIWGCEVVYIDATGGWAAGPTDALHVAGFPPVEIEFHGPAFDRRYKNRRCEMWNGMAEWVRRGAALPPMEELVPELTEPTYTVTASGQYLVEPKEIIKKRLGYSPDLADALALTFAHPDQPRREAGERLRRPARAESDWDPYRLPED